MRQARLERFKHLLEGKLSAQVTELEVSIADMEDAKFKVGDQYELYYKKNEYASYVTVEDVLDEMIKVKFAYAQNDAYGNQQNTQWISTDSDKIQPINTYIQSGRTKFSEHFEKLLEQKLKA